MAPCKSKSPITDAPSPLYSYQTKMVVHQIDRVSKIKSFLHFDCKCLFTDFFFCVCVVKGNWLMLFLDLTHLSRIRSVAFVYQIQSIFIFSAIIMIWLFFLHRNWIGACYMKMRISCSFFWGLFYVWFSWFGCFNSVCAERCCSVFRVHCGSGCKQDQRWEVHPRWNWVLIAS